TPGPYTRSTTPRHRNTVGGREVPGRRSRCPWSGVTNALVVPPARPPARPRGAAAAGGHSPSGVTRRPGSLVVQGVGQVAVGGAADGVLAVGVDDLPPPGAVDPVEVVGLQEAQGAADRAGALRDEVGVAVHEAHPV